MKKQFLLLYSFFIVSFGFSFNIDYGATIDSYTGANLEEDASVFGFEKVSLYSSLQFTERVSFAVDGFYKFTYNTETAPDEPNTFDFTSLVLTMPFGEAGMMLGRTTMRDFSGDIFSHTLDGVVFNYPLSFGSLIFNGGYSGLINSNEVSLFTVDDEDWIERIVEGVDLVVPMENTSLWASLYSQQDISDDMETIDNNLSIYGGAGVRSSIGTSLYYSVRGNVQFGQFYYIDDSGDDAGANLFAGMGALTLTWYLQSENETVRSLAPYAVLDFGMSSGDANLSTTSIGSEQSDIGSSVSLYSPLTSGGPGTIYSVNNQNLTYVKLQASVSPLSNLQTQLGSVLFFRTVEGPTSDTDFTNYEESGKYLGTEISATVNYRLFSDLGIALSGGVFVPSTLLDGDPTGLVTAYVSLSL